MTEVTLALEHAGWGGKCASHRNYMMGCADFEDLWLSAGGRCVRCGGPGGLKPLQIDHEPARGRWAVRGLLCLPCNTGLPRTRRSPSTVRYLANPWYVGMLARRRVALTMPPEPALGAEVAASRWRFRRYSSGWHRLGSSVWRTAHPWSWLYRRYGPHNLTTGYTRERVRQICREAGIESEGP